MPVKVTSVHEAHERFGYVTSLIVDGKRVWGVGGPFGGTTDRPICVHRSFGTTFYSSGWELPFGISGLRDAIVIKDRLWVVGEHGFVATTAVERGDTFIHTRPWRRHDIGIGDRCVYRIALGAKGQMWFTGDAGFAARGSRGKFEVITNRSKGRIVGLHVEPEAAWLLDTNGLLQRVSAAGVTAVAVPGPGELPLTAMARTFTRTLVLVGDGGRIARSTDDGGSWQRVALAGTADDLEQIIVARTGIYIVGDRGSLLVSHDDARSFTRLDTELGGHLFSIAETSSGDLVVGGEAGQIWQLDRRDLLQSLAAHVERSDPALAGVARCLADGDEGAELVFEDALRQRSLWG